MKKNTVAIIEDHTLLSEAIAGVVEKFDQFEVAFLCKNGADLIETLKKKPLPKIVLMDVNMPIMNGIETTKWLTENHPEVYVLALTVEEDESTILKMIRAGAKGYLLKDVDKKTLEFALLKTIETGFYHSNIVVDVLVNSVTGKNGHMEVLKDTEIEFLKLLCTEMTYKEIANKMNLSPKTIDGYRDNLFVKLNVKNRIGLVIYAIKNKIFTC
ncbi:response regulator transcription factor [Flavobacterium amniphilum]|uniref:response regulator transcription factor n=1 Tax=Flavobacterium amniphilum TaxID=1834035 RepID=UPI00202A4EC4|nr:response regulator transcription factor [Flavobacterium amniphilum]MCL9804981.1 response regulator transcription factor [Flavobacterium amniphilum]